MRILTVTLTLLALFAGCNKNASETSASSITTPPPSPALPEPAPPPHAADHPSPQGALPSAAELGPAKAGGLVWSDPPGLLRHPPKNNMRAAEYAVDGDEEAQLTVFYFGEGQGGAVEPNVTRWLAQFKQPDGRDTAAVAKRTELNVGSVHVARVEVTGSYGGGMGMPGMAAPAPVADGMLLGAIATGPKGPVFFKLTGARASVTRAKPAFDALVQSLRSE